MVGPLVEEGGLVEPCIPWRKHRSHSRSWGSGGGGRTASGDRSLVTPLGAGRVLASMRRTSMMKCAIWAGGVFQGASGRCVSVSIAVGAFGVVVCLDDSFDLTTHREEEDCLDEFVHVFGVNGDNHRSRFLGESSLSVLVRVPGRVDRGLFRVLDGLLEEGIQLVIVFWEDFTRD